MESIAFNGAGNISDGLSTSYGITRQRRLTLVQQIEDPYTSESRKVKVEAVLNAIDELRHPQEKMAYVLFFICGIGMSMAWYSISAAVAYFATKFGDSIFRLFLAFYNVPALPLLIAQARYDDKYNQKYGAATAYKFRVIVAVIVLLTCVLVLPFGPPKAVVLIVVALVGVFDSVGYGAMSQMAGKFPPKSSIYLLMGQSMSSVLLLIITLILKFSDEASTGQLYGYFYFAGAFVVVGLISFFKLVNSDIADFCLNDEGRKAREEVQAAALQLEEETDDDAFAEYDNRPPAGRSDSPSFSGFGGRGAPEGDGKSSFVSLSDVAKDEETGADDDVMKDSLVGSDHYTSDEVRVMGDLTGSGNQLDTSAIQGKIKFQIFSVTLVWFTTLMAQSFLTELPADSMHANTLSQVMVYVSLFSQFAGKQLTMFRIPSIFNSPRKLFIAVVVHFCTLLPYMLYLTKNIGFVNDYVIIIVMVFFFVWNGYAGTLVYKQTSNAVSKTESVVATGYINIYLMVGIIGGIICSIILAPIIL